MELVDINTYANDKDFMFVECKPGEYCDQYGLKKGCTYKVFQGYEYDDELVEGDVFKVLTKNKKHDCDYKIKMGEDLFSFKYDYETSYVFQLIEEA